MAFFIAPETVPMHFGLDGEANRYGSKAELFVLGGIMSGCNLLMLACYAGCGKLHAIGMLNVPASVKDPVKVGRIILLITAAFLAVLTVGLLCVILSAA